MKEKILITAKTYPNLSKRYVETVCVGGITLDGNWVRLYPIRFRKLPRDKQFHKFDLIEADIERTNDKFMRRENHKVKNGSIKIIGGLPVSLKYVNKKTAKDNWKKRKKILLSVLDKSIESLEKEKKTNKKTLGIIKPKKIVDFYKKDIEECREWEKDLVEGTQKQLFEKEYKSPLDKVPYWMGYHFFCDDKKCKGHNMMCEDWETLQLFRQMKKRYGTNEEAFKKVKEKQFDWMVKERDLYFIVGTESRHNKFLIVSIFYPPKEEE